MKMKNLFLGMSLLTAAGLWTGCSNDEVVDAADGKQAISFRVQGGMPDLRATGTTKAYVDAFVVYGTDNVFAAKDELIFDGVTVALQTDGTFDYAPKRFHAEGAVNAGYFAFSPASAKVSNPVTAGFLTAGASFDYTVPKPDDSGNTTQEDLLVSNTAVAAILSYVNLDFTHALSRIFITASNHSVEPVIIDTLTLRNLFSKGTLKVNAPSATWAWTDHTDKMDYQYMLAPTGVAVPANSLSMKLVTSMEQGMMVLPQETANTGSIFDFDPGDFALEVKYQFANLGKQTKLIMVHDGFEFEANKQYLIHIDFTAWAIEFTIDVLDFENYGLINVLELLE